MALVITSTVAVNDSTTSYAVAVSGKINPSANVDFIMKIGGVTVSTASTSGSTSTFLNVLASEIYDNANGKSLTNLVTVDAFELDGLGNTVQTATKSGNVTINARCSSLSIASIPNPYDLDAITNIIASWTRPHTAFRGRITVYVNGVWCFSRYGFGTSANFDPNDYSGYVTNMINAMGGISPREFKVVLQSQFNANTIIDLSGGLLTATRTNGVIKSFIQKSDLLTFGAFTIGNNITFSIDVNSVGVTHDLEVKFGTTVVITRTGLTGSETSITPTAGEITAMYNATASVTSITATMTLTTKDGSDVVGTSALTATASVDASIKPNFTTVTHSEGTTVPAVATLVGAYVQGISKLNLAITGAVAGTGASIKSYKITFESNIINAVSGVTVPIVGSGSINIVGRVTDTRDRYLEKTVTVTVLAYENPKIISFSLDRATSGGVLDPLGDYIKFTFNVSVSSLINGVQKNSLTYVTKTKIKDAVSYTTKETVVVGALTFNGSELYSGYSILDAFEGRLEITDIFATIYDEKEIGTGVVIMSWDDVGVGIGKIRQNGILDVSADDAGDSIYADGKIYSAGSQLKSVAETLLACYPIGAIYTSVVSTNPATLFGGTWSAIASGRVLVGINAGDPDFDTVEESGGSKTHVHSVPTHTHGLASGWAYVKGNATNVWYRLKNVATWTDTYKNAGTGSTSATSNTNATELGGTTDANASANTGSGSNVMPYLVVYMWKRTA